MLNGDAAKYRTQDMLRRSEAHRAGTAAAKRRSERRTARVRTAMSSLAALVTLPVNR